MYRLLDTNRPHCLVQRLRLACIVKLTIITTSWILFARFINSFFILLFWFATAYLASLHSRYSVKSSCGRPPTQLGLHSTPISRAIAEPVSFEQTRIKK